MSTPQDEAPNLPNLPTVAAEYRRAAGNASTQQLAQAMALLQRSAARATFPRDAAIEDMPDDQIVMSRLPAVPTALESAVLASRHQQKKTEREASRLYAVARPFI